MTAVEWFQDQIIKIVNGTCELSEIQIFNQAKEMESQEKLKHQLFIGKVTEMLGFDKTLELLKQCNNEIK